MGGNFRIKLFKQEKRRYLTHYLSDKGLKETTVKLLCPSLLNERHHEITMTDPRLKQLIKRFSLTIIEIAMITGIF